MLMSENKNYEILKNNNYENIILEWRNDKLTRNNSVNQEIISESDHKNWLNQQLNNKTTTLIMHFYKNKPAGLIKLDKLSDKEYGISINLNPTFRGKKLSSLFIQNSIHFLIENQEDKNISIFASIKPNNIASIKAFERSGFKISDKKFDESLLLFSIEVIKSKSILFLGYPENETKLISYLIEKGFKVHNDYTKLDSSIFTEFDLVISYGYRFILTKSQLENCIQPPINLHISLLPWNRGSHPNFWAFYDKTPHGVTIHHIDEGIDTGNIIIQKEIFFNDKISFKESYLKLREEIEDLFLSNLSNILYNTNKNFTHNFLGSFHQSKDLPLDLNWDSDIDKYLETLKDK